MPRRSPLLAAALAAVCALPAIAGAQTVTATPGTQYNATGPVRETATGSSMTGMLVTAGFADGTTLSGTWGALGTQVLGVDDYGVVFGGRLRVSHLDTDTYPLTPWYLQQLGGARVTSLAFDGAPGATVFDRYTSTLFGLVPTVGTPGSGVGGDYDEYVLRSRSTAVYSDLVSVDGAAPVGDLYRRLTITFDADLPRSVVTGAREVYFGLDTDRVTPSAVVPEPSTYALLGTGLAGLLAAARRRRSA